MEKKEIAVGDSTKLEIIFSTKKYKSRITKRPKIQTNEGPPDKYVQIITDVVTRPDSTYPIVIRPYKLDLSQFGEKVRDEVSFKITNVSDEKLKVSMISDYEDYFKVKLPKSISPGKTVEAKLKLNKESIDKSFEKSFTVELDDEKQTRFTIPVKRKLRPSGKPTAKTGAIGNK
ncbi:MAG: hypothetical protein ACE5D6_03190 [Candidatus Zixiibacteriota bacterium]